MQKIFLNARSLLTASAFVLAAVMVSIPTAQASSVRPGRTGPSEVSFSNHHVTLLKLSDARHCRTVVVASEVLNQFGHLAHLGPRHLGRAVALAPRCGRSLWTARDRSHSVGEDPTGDCGVGDLGGSSPHHASFVPLPGPLAATSVLLVLLALLQIRRRRQAPSPTA